MKQVLSSHRFRVGPSLPPGRFRAVDTRWVPVLLGAGLFLGLSGLLTVVGSVGSYARVTGPDQAIGHESVALIGGCVGGALLLLGALLSLWGWLRQRAARQVLPLGEPPSMIHARWSERARA
jgi:hypothetical protein